MSPYGPSAMPDEKPSDRLNDTPLPMPRSTAGGTSATPVGIKKGMPRHSRNIPRVSHIFYQSYFSRASNFSCSTAFVVAPTNLSTSSPFLKKSRVGIVRTP